MPSRDDKIRSIVAFEIDCMDMEGLIDYAEQNLSKYLYEKNNEVINDLYQAINEDYDDHKEQELL